jgi:biotin-(acetyl-CoA carboxylase) ligase
LKDEGFLLNKDEVISKFLENFTGLSENMLKNGFNTIRELWLKYAYNFEKEIIISNNGEKIKGIFKDLDMDGVLILECGGKIMKIYSADVL